MKIKQITIHSEEKELENAEGIFLIDPKWVNLDSDEVREVIDKGQKIFKVNFTEDKK